MKKANYIKMAVAASVFASLWMFLIMLFNVFFFIEGFAHSVYFVFPIAAVCISILSYRQYFRQTDIGIQRKIGSIALSSILMFILMRAISLGVVMLLYYIIAITVGV